MNEAQAAAEYHEPGRYEIHLKGHIDARWADRFEEMRFTHERDVAAPEASAYLAADTLLLAVKEWTFILGPHLLLGVNTLIYSYLLYKTQLVPRPLAIMGLTGAVLIQLAAVLELFGLIGTWSLWVGLLAAPIGVYEMILAGWLIARGFNPAATASRPATTASSELLNAPEAPMIGRVGGRAKCSPAYPPTLPRVDGVPAPLIAMYRRRILT